MTSRRKLFQQYAQTGGSGGGSSVPAPGPKQAGFSPGHPGSSRRPGPGPRRAGFQPSPGGGVITQHPAPGASIHPGSVGEIEPVNPRTRLTYAELTEPQGEIVNSPHCYLPNSNPYAAPTVDRGRPLSSFDKAVRLGSQPQPSTLIDIPRGDAGTGGTMFRRTQIFASMAAVGTNVADIPMNRAIGITTQRSSDNRPRNWQVSVFGVGLISSEALARGPLTDTQILQNGGFLGNSGGNNVGSTLPYVPQATTFKARAMIHDESGQRYFDFDVLGTRTFAITAYAVSIFILVPEGGQEVNRQDPGSVPALSGILQDAIVGARVVPMSFERPNRPIRQTQTITVGNNLAPLSARMPIPPGAKKVQIYNQSRAANAQLHTIDFDAVSSTVVGPTVAVSTMGPIVLDPVTFRSDIIEVPNASSIVFTAFGAAIGTSFVAEFEVDP